VPVIGMKVIVWLGWTLMSFAKNAPV
jgi:hypothetical protein